MGVEAREKGVVVEHLLEVGDEPEGVGGVSVKTAANLVVHSAGGHLVEGKFKHFEGEGHPGSAVVAEQEFEGLGLWELGLESEAAGAVVELAG